METAWKFLRSGAIKLLAIQDSDLPEIQALMRRYWDRPMDFVDVTLVCLARREGLYTIFTVDHAGFATYRIEGRRRFRVLPRQAASGVRDARPLMPFVKSGLPKRPATPWQSAEVGRNLALTVR